MCKLGESERIPAVGSMAHMYQEMNNTRNSMQLVLPSQGSYASTKLKLTPSKSSQAGKGKTSDKPSSDKQYWEYGLWDTFIHF